MLLEVEGLHVRYGRTHALRGIDLTVDDGEIVTVLGANGAKISAGKADFDGKSILPLRLDQRLRRGLVLVPEGRQILVSLTVHENLKLGAYQRRDDAAVAAEIEAIYARFDNLARRRDMLASCLSGGEQQMLAIGRALLARPRLLMLDEPSLGLSPLLVQRVFGLIASLNRDGLAILLIEQNTNMALSVAHRSYLLELGSIVRAGSAADMRRDDILRTAYLGASV
jgi:branched-chain amino acid transport system ATP-binding protein